MTDLMVKKYIFFLDSLDLNMRDNIEIFCY
jgi:hypothetical protein